MSGVLPRHPVATAIRQADRTFSMPAESAWPPLSYRSGQPTYETLRRWMQVVGKVRLALVPHVNHWWNIAFDVTPRGVSSGAMPHGDRHLRAEFDLLDHRLLLESSDGGQGSFALEPMSVKRFYQRFMDALTVLDARVRIWTPAVEVADATPLDEDEHHRTYDPAEATRFLHALQHAHRVLSRFHATWRGKSRPTQFFWGGFDVALSRFSGRPAPPHPGAPHVARHVTDEAYSEEVSSAGWWPGDEAHEASFFSYAYPEPPGYREHPVVPAEASYDEALREFVLPYHAVQVAPDPDDVLLDFLRTTFEAAKRGGGWDARKERALDWRPAPPVLASHVPYDHVHVHEHGHDHDVTS